ncbi:Pentatricopeptide repeat [Dillenia turbinata]|uniref:Pentatricopeptide repeat n=1 Tax=Dillenia turbinata TaxID=194707 RepID=A0AAN8WB14_9MAGN
MGVLSRTSLNSTRNYFLRRNRRWPHSPYKAKWHELFARQQAMQTLMKSASELPPTPTSNPKQQTHLLSSLINSFALYNCKPDPHAYQFVIKTLARNTQFHDIQFVLDHLENVEDFEVPEFIVAEVIKIYGCIPSAISLNSLLTILCKNRKGLKLVPGILLKSSQMMKIRVEQSSYRILINALCRIKRFGHAIEMLNCMISDGYIPDVTFYSLILSAMCDHNVVSPNEVLGFLGNMKDSGFSPSMVDYSNVIKFLVKQKKGMDALDVLSQMKSDRIKPDVVCYTMVLDGVIGCGDFGKAEEMFDEMLLLGLVPDVSTYNVYINGLCKQNNVETGVKMLSCMEDMGCKPNTITYNILLCSVCKIGDLGRAMTLFSEMSLKNIPCDLQTYTIIIDSLISKGEVIEACGLFKDMLSKKLNPSSSSTFDEILCRLCQQGLVIEALLLLGEAVVRMLAPGSNAWEALLLLCVSNPHIPETILID